MTLVDNAISDVTPLSPLRLEGLSLHGNAISDLSPLVRDSRFRASVLDVSENLLDCGTQLANLTQLAVRGMAVTHDCVASE